MNNLIYLIKKVREQYPMLRIGQLLSLAAKRGGWEQDDLFYCPDEKIIKGLESMVSSFTIN